MPASDGAHKLRIQKGPERLNIKCQPQLYKQLKYSKCYGAPGWKYPSGEDPSGTYHHSTAKGRGIGGKGRGHAKGKGRGGKVVGGSITN